MRRGFCHLDVKESLSERRLCASGKMAGMVLSLLLLAGLGLTASSPALHRLICPDAGQADDYCVVKQFQSGLVEAPLAQALVVAALPGLSLLPCYSDEVHLIMPLYRLSPSRAPPSAFSLC